MKTASAGGCPFACGGGIPVKPFTLMGEGMLVTVGALMPGGVLPPAATRQTGREEGEADSHHPVFSKSHGYVLVVNSTKRTVRLGLFVKSL